MKVALVHDYLDEFGGAERVLLALSEIYPEAPIMTAFYRKNSPAGERFKDKDVRTSWAQRIPGFAGKLHSPLRFLASKIWNSFSETLEDYDLVISSASWYVTKGFGTRGGKRKKPVEICYCHTPPRWLYGYPTSVEWKKYKAVRIYGNIVGHFMRQYDFRAAQRVNFFVANSKNVQKRIKKFYRRDSKVIYPPVSLPLKSKADLPGEKEDYYLITSRIVGGKGLELAVKAVEKLGLKLKIAGEPAGYKQEQKRLEKLTSGRVELLGRVSDKELVELYKGAKAFLALAEKEDFGMTPVEAMLMGTAVIAFRGGGYVESVVEGKTGYFFDEPTVDSFSKVLKKFDDLDYKNIKPEDCVKQAKKFSKSRFKREIKDFVEEKVKKA